MSVLPCSLSAMLSLLRPAFSVPSFQTCEALIASFIGRVGERTVCGMWQAARLAGVFIIPAAMTSSLVPAGRRTGSACWCSTFYWSGSLLLRA